MAWPGSKPRWRWLAAGHSRRRLRRASAQYLVLRTNPPTTARYPIGRALDSRSRIVLDPNEFISIWGPAARASFAAREVSRRRLRRDLGKARRISRQSRLMGMRGEGERPTDFWYLDTTRGGSYCAPDRREIILWRPPAAQIALTLRPARGRRIAIDWPANQETRAWPRGVPIAFGSRYRLTRGRGRPVLIIFRRVDSAPTDLFLLARALIENDCGAQLRVFIEQHTE